MVMQWSHKGQDRTISTLVKHSIMESSCMLHFSNHRNWLKQLCGLYSYHHFNSDGHTLEDIDILPMEEVVSEPNDTISLTCKRLKREDFWYRDLCTIYPYCLNDNVKGLANVSSKKDQGLVVYGLFNKSRRKFRKRT